MSDEIHRESVEFIVGTLRQFIVPLCCNTYESLLKKSKMNGIINVRIGGAPEVICHHVGLWILLLFFPHVVDNRSEYWMELEASMENEEWDHS